MEPTDTADVVGAQHWVSDPPDPAVSASMWTVYDPEGVSLETYYKETEGFISYLYEFNIKGKCMKCYMKNVA
jgi:hypothetical protein